MRRVHVQPPPLAGHLALLLLVVATVFALSEEGSSGQVSAQTNRGSYVPVETWESAEAGLPAGSWRQVSGLAVAADGRVYVSDADEARITLIDSDGSTRVLVPPSTSSGGLVSPRHLAVDSDAGRLYVADGGANAVLVFDLAGSLLARWPGVPGAQAIAVTRVGEVLVGSAATGQVHRFAPDGSPIAVWPAFSAASGACLQAIDVDADGLVYALSGDGRLLRTFDPGGAMRDETEIGLAGAATRAWDVSVDYDPNVSPERKLWLATRRGLVQYYPRAKGWATNPIGSDLVALVADRTHGVWVAAAGPGGEVGGRVMYLPYSAALTSAPERTWSGSLLQPGTLRAPEVIDIGGDGLAYVLDRWRRVQRFELDGNVLGQMLRVNPAAAAAAPDGTIYVTDGGSIWAFAAADWSQSRPRELWMIGIASGRAGVNAVALKVDPVTGDLVVLDAASGELRRFAPSGKRGRSTRLPVPAGGSAVWADLDIRPDGEVLVLDRSNRLVVIVTAAGEVRTIALPAAARRIAAGIGSSFFTLGRDGWVRRYDSSGALTAAFDATRFDIATESGPSDLDIDESGDVYVTDRAADVVSRFRWDLAASSTEPPESGAVCRNFAAKSAKPGQLDLGQNVGVRLTVRGGCGSDYATEPLDIVLVLDRSGSMGGDRLRVLQGAALNFVADMNLSVSRIAVVSFNDTAKVEQGLTQHAELLQRAIMGLTAEGGTKIDRGLLSARAELGRRRRPVGRPIFVVLSDGSSDLSDAKEQADIAKERGVEIYSVGIQAWERLMREIATDDDHYFSTDSARLLYGIFDRIAQRVTATALFKSIDVSDQVPENMRYVPGSAEPPAVWDAAQRMLRWSITDVPFNGFALSYELEPTEAGEWPTNVRAWGDFVDGYGKTGRVDFPVPTVRVFGPPATPVTPGATPGVTATPGSATATPSPSVGRRAILIPLALRERCKPGQKHADVVLVMDTSSSMRGAKLSAAKEAAKLFVASLALPADRVGLVAFDSSARLVTELTTDATLLGTAIDSLAVRPGTRIDLGLDEARGELGGPRHLSDNAAVIVLLTDGRQDDGELVRASARAARDQGVVIFAIGLGSDVDQSLLVDVAGGRGQTYLAPGPRDLAEIYSRIAVQVPCPPESFWGGR